MHVVPLGNALRVGSQFRLYELTELNLLSVGSPQDIEYIC